MNDLIKMVSERAGISEEQARKAVEAVADFAKGRFPMLAGHIDGLLSGGGGGGGDLGKMFGGLFGR